MYIIINEIGQVEVVRLGQGDMRGDLNRIGKPGKRFTVYELTNPIEICYEKTKMPRLRGDRKENAPLRGGHQDHD